MTLGWVPAQLIKVQRRDLDHQNRTHINNLSKAVHICNPRAGEAETVNPLGFLASQLSLFDKSQANEKHCLKKAKQNKNRVMRINQKTLKLFPCVE